MLVDLLAEVGSFRAVSLAIVSAIFKPGALQEVGSGKGTRVTRRKPGQDCRDPPEQDGMELDLWCRVAYMAP